MGPPPPPHPFYFNFFYLFSFLISHFYVIIFHVFIYLFRVSLCMCIYILLSLSLCDFALSLYYIAILLASWVGPQWTDLDSKETSGNGWENLGGGWTGYRLQYMELMEKSIKLVEHNYRPVSNLPFLSKILEKLVFNQVNDFLIANNISERCQSGFRMNHNTF